MKLLVVALFLPLLVVSCISCSTAQKRKPEIVRSEQSIRLENCELAINKIHEKTIQKDLMECVVGAGPWVCPLQNIECVRDLIGFCKTRERRLLQFQIFQCVESEDIDLFLKSIPRDAIVTPQGVI